MTDRFGVVEYIRSCRESRGCADHVKHQPESDTVDHGLPSAT